MVLGVDDRISCDGSPSIGAIVPLAFSSVEPNVDVVVNLIMVEVNMCNIGIINQTSHSGGVHCVWLIRHCPSDIIINWFHPCVLPEGSSEPYKQDVVVSIPDDGTR